MSTIGIVGAGNVGATIAYACLVRGSAERLALHDVQGDRVRAQVLDLRHGQSFVPHAEIVGDDEVAVLAGADVVVHTASVRYELGQTRLDLAGRNVELLRDLVPRVLEVAPNALQIVVANPVDVLTDVIRALSGLPAARVIGTGTLLDSARFRALLATRCGVDAHDVQAYVVGEHGDSEVLVWSSATIAGVPVRRWVTPGGTPLTAAEEADIRNEVVRTGYEIVAGKGATTFAIALATARLCEAVLRNEHVVFPVSAGPTGVLGLPDVSLSLPRIVDRRGAGPPLPLDLDDHEQGALRASAHTIAGALRSLGF